MYYHCWSPHALEPVLCNKSLQWEALTSQLESSPHPLQLEKVRVQQWRPSTAKNKLIKLFCKKTSDFKEILLLQQVDMRRPSKSPAYVLFSSTSELVKLLSRVRLLATPWTVAYQAPPPMEFCRQEYWSGLPFSSPIFFYTREHFDGSTEKLRRLGLLIWQVGKIIDLAVWSHFGESAIKCMKFLATQPVILPSNCPSGVPKSLHCSLISHRAWGKWETVLRTCLGFDLVSMGILWILNGPRTNRDMTCISWSSQLVFCIPGHSLLFPTPAVFSFSWL